MIQSSDRFDFRRLLRFTFPSIVMPIFTSIYGVAGPRRRGARSQDRG